MKNLVKVQGRLYETDHDGLCCKEWTECRVSPDKKKLIFKCHVCGKYYAAERVQDKGGKQ